MATLKIMQDDHAQSPRGWDNLGVMACWHRRYRLGDVQPKEPPDEWLKENAPEGSVVLPLYLFDHSGITMSTSAARFRACDSMGWDWGRVGVIVATPEAIRKEYSRKHTTRKLRERVEACLLAEVKVYVQFLTGAVYGYTYEDQDGHDSCWGFFGESLEETGIINCLPVAARPLAQRAWDAMCRGEKDPVSSEDAA